MKTFLKNHRYHFALLFFLLLTSTVSAGYLRASTKTVQAEAKKESISLLANISSQTDQPNNTNSTSKKSPAPTIQPASDQPIKTNKTITTTTNQPANGQNPPSNNLTSTIYVNDQKYELALPTNSTVYQAMNLLSQQTDFTFGGKQYSSLGFFIDEINGLKNNSKTNKYWIYYINGQSAKAGVSNYIIKPKDIITWKYEASQF